MQINLNILNNMTKNTSDAEMVTDMQINEPSASY